jgi:heme oxygenase (mycobilin-producing)
MSMFTVINELRVKPADEQEFERIFAGSMDDTLPGVDGLIRATLTRRTGDADLTTYLSTLEFSSEQKFRAYLGSPAFRAAHGGMVHAPIAGNALHTYTAVHQIPR